MAKHLMTTITATPAEITNANITTFAFQNNSVDEEVFLWGSVDSAAPDYNTAARISVPPGAMLAGFTLEQLFPGLAGANRIFAAAEKRRVQIMFSHA
ncbi:hypothetical protein [Seohaeicola zhoushanensis]|uniref:Uncharacterized protein n=1 Tax=Seohaeicola zhoushanensis TaxID=1569283 RepID=A0A8J3GTR5_9RHOB|nr:hypothetical protein [Seohaeicola zhoushanensis]GHF33419.1 hypothetical protein GCM10017056_01040 [Seohaeicola zhoushanensis]